MDDLENGPKDGAAGSPAAASAAPANFGSGADTLPLSVPAASSHKDDKAEKDSAEQKTRDILRKLQKEAEGEEVDDAPTEELDDAQATDDDEETDEATGATPASEKKQTPPPDAPTPEALNEAREALVRDGWTLADLEKFPPERMLELGTKARQRQQAGDRFGSTKAQEIAVMKAKLAELEGATPTNNPQQGQQQQTQAPDPASDPVLMALKSKMSKLGELASPEAQAVIEDALASIYTASGAQAQRQVAALTQQFQAMQAATEQQLLTAARKAVGKEYPDLRDNAKWDEVQKKALAFAKSGLYGPGEVERVVRDAAATMFKPGIKDVQRKMLEKSRRARDGQPDAGQQGSTQQAPKTTPADQSKRILKLMQQGKSPEQARRLALAGK